MKKWKIPLLLIVTLAMLILCASFPQLAAMLLDGKSGKNPSYSEMQSVQLDLTTTRNTLPMIGKLALISNMETVNIVQTQAAMSEDEVQASVVDFMQACEHAGFFEGFEPTQFTMLPKLGLDMSNASNYLIFWTVTLINEKEPNQVLLLDVDDETGKILCVSFDIYTSYSMDGVWDRNKAVMEQFTDLYFDQLGLLETAEAVESSAFAEYREVDGGVSETVYSFADPTYGAIHIQFTVDGAGGFKITFL